jgi:hypothetical protein
MLAFVYYECDTGEGVGMPAEKSCAVVVPGAYGRVCSDQAEVRVLGEGCADKISEDSWVLLQTFNPHCD